METQTDQEVVDKYICSYCGGKLEVATVDDGEMVICRPCGRMCSAIEPEIYVLAKEYVQERHWSYYHYTTISDDKRREMANISHFCDIIKWVKRKTELPGEDGS